MEELKKRGDALLLEARQHALPILVCLLGIAISVVAWLYPWLALTLCLLATIWATCFAVRQGRHSSGILRLVDERTRELHQQTLHLSALNQKLLRENSERRKVEEALRDSERRYRLLAENASDVIYTHDFDFRWTYISPSVQSQRGWSVEEAYGLPMHESLTPESFRRSRQAMEEALEFIRTSPTPPPPGAYRILELDAVCRDGSTITIENRASFLFDESGTPIGVLGVSRDISKRKQMEHEKLSLEHHFRHAQKMDAIGRLAGGVAHDFNNLLTGILGHTDLIKRELDETTPAHRGIEVVEKAAQRARQLTGQLLGFARKGKQQDVPVDINESIRDIGEFLERTIDKNIVVSQQLTEGSATTRGDPGQIHQLLLNLAVNARDAMSQGGQLAFETHIENLDDSFCRRHLGTRPGRYVIIRVSDTGEGMSREKQDHIFEPFFTDKPEGQGTGMGLATVYGVAQSHQGAVTVYSEVGIGSTFRVYLPYEDAEIQAPLDDHLAGTPVTGGGRILVVDDEEILRDLATQMLGQLGYEVITMPDGEQACAWFSTHREEIDMAIVDMIMPNMGGWECVQGLRSYNPRLPVLMSTGYSRKDVAEKLEENELVGFIQKPYQMQQLSEVVADMLANQPA